jgi:hypothetical protein
MSRLKLYNPLKKQRAELPEYDKRLLVRNHSLLSQRFSIDSNKMKITDSLEKLIDKYPLEVFRHIYEYKTRKLTKLTLCSVGYSMLYKKMDLIHPDIIDKLRDRKRQNKARLNLKKKGII